MKPHALLAFVASLSVLLLGCVVLPPPQALAEPVPAGAERPLHVGFLIVDGVYDTELMAPLDVFHHTVFHTEPGMKVFTVAPSRDPVTTFEGLRILPDHALDDAPEIDVLVVPSAKDSMTTDLQDTDLIGWVKTAGFRARYVVSLCDGAFVLAQAGLLDGKQATTFPGDIGLFRIKYEKVDCLDGPSFVHDGNAITSVGGARSYEAALYLCELLYGKEVADGIARGLVIDWDLVAIPHVIAGAGARPASAE